jgi:hypothetical protein
MLQFSFQDALAFFLPADLATSIEHLVSSYSTTYRYRRLGLGSMTYFGIVRVGIPYSNKNIRSRIANIFFKSIL